MRNASVATVKDPSANFHASPSLLSRHVVMVGSESSWLVLSEGLMGLSALVCGDGADSVPLSL